MSKKMMLLALAVASVAMFALPSAASAAPDHIDGVAEFTGIIDSGGTYVVAEEPTFSCKHGHIIGSFDPGGTTGSLTLDFTDCTGFAGLAKCHSAGSPLGDTIAMSATFHMITINNKPAVTLTPSTFEINCGEPARLIVEGNGVIGTIASPACNVDSHTMTIQVLATAATQNHLEYTGVKYDLKAKTSGQPQVTVGWNTAWTLEWLTKGKVTCT